MLLMSMSSCRKYLINTVKDRLEKHKGDIAQLSYYAKAGLNTQKAYPEQKYHATIRFFARFEETLGKVISILSKEPGNLGEVEACKNLRKNLIKLRSTCKKQEKIRRIEREESYGEFLNSVDYKLRQNKYTMKNAMEDVETRNASLLTIFESLAV